MSKNKKPMSMADAARIQAAEAKANDGKVAKGSFAARAMSTAAKNQQQTKQGE